MTESQSTTAPRGDSAEGALEFFQRSPNAAIVVGAAAIVLGTLLAYLPAVRGEFIWDDDYYVTRNPLLANLTGLQRIWFDIVPSPANYPLPQYYPMTHTSFWIEARLWGRDNPMGFRIVNVLLHAGNALLIWLILRKLAVPGAWVAAAIFAVHPINVESVAWIAERKNVLSGFFFFSSLYVYLRFSGIIPGPEKPDEYLSLPKEPPRVWGLAFALFVFALASKTVTATLPAVVLLLIWWKRGRIVMYQKDAAEKMGFRSDVLPLVPFFVLGIAASMLTGWMEVHRVGAVGPDWQHGSGFFSEAVARCLIAGSALWFYVWKLFLPYPLSFNYPRWEISLGAPVLWFNLLAAIAVVTAFAVSVRKIGRGPLVAVLYFIGTLVPALGFFNVFPHRFSFVADHFVYLSSIGLIALVVATVVNRFRWIQGGASSIAPGPAAATMAVLAVFTVLSLARSSVFATPKNLWEDTWRKNRQSWFAANNYGVLLRDARGDLDAAEQWFNKVIELRPQHPEARFNLAVIAERRGQPQQAEALYREAIRLLPSYGRAHYQLGQLYLAQNRAADAEIEFRAAVDIDPHRADLARNALGLLLAQQAKALLDHGQTEPAYEKYDEAIDQYVAALDANPEFAAARNSLAITLDEVGRLDEAVAQWTIALQHEPNNASILNNLGRIAVMRGHFNEAGAFFERAVRNNPQSPLFRTNLGTVAGMLGHADLARQQFEIALKIDPDYAPARQKLAELESGKLAAATQEAAHPDPPATEPAP